MHGIPVTNRARTALDCGRLLPRLAAAAAVDAFLHAGLVTSEELDDQADRFVARRNVRQLRWVIDNAEPLAESAMESWTRVRLIDGGLPRPQAQLPVARPGGATPYRLDMGYEEYHVGLEYDGAGHHSANDQIRHDRSRRKWLEDDRGWRILVAREADVMRGWRLLVSSTAEALIARGWIPPRGGAFSA